MQVLYNPSGLHIHKGLLKARFDLYPATTDKLYQVHHVYVVDETSSQFKAGYKGKLNPDGSPKSQSAYDTWEAGLPHVWKLNPFLCHSIVVPEIFLTEDLQEYIARTFTKDTLASLDQYMYANYASHLSSHFAGTIMRAKTPFTQAKIQTQDYADLILSTNQKLSGLALPFDGGGSVLDIQPQSITMGPGATDRSSYKTYGSTRIDKNLAAAATGTIDTWQLYFVTFYAATGVKIGTFSFADTKWTNRDGESWGDVAAGSAQTLTGQNTSVVTGDQPGVYYAAGRLEFTTTGTGITSLGGDQFGTGAQSYTGEAGAMSIYGTGTEAVTAKTGTDTGAGADAQITGNPRASFFLTDSGAVTDSLPIRGFAIPEVGAVTDLASLLADLAASDSGVGTELEAIIAELYEKFGSDTGTGVDAKIDFPESLNILAEAGVVTDEVVSSLLQIIKSDSGVGTEASLIGLTSSDSGVGVDSLLSRLLAVYDSLAGTDLAAVFAAMQATDTGAGTDASTIFKALIAADSGLGTDAKIAITNALTALETGLGTDYGIQTIDRFLLISYVLMRTALQIKSKQETGLVLSTITGKALRIESSSDTGLVLSSKMDTGLQIISKMEAR